MTHTMKVLTHYNRVAENDSEYDTNDFESCNSPDSDGCKGGAAGSAPGEGMGGFETEVTTLVKALVGSWRCILCAP